MGVSDCTLLLFRYVVYTYDVVSSLTPNLGLMTAKFAPLWEEASKALAQVVESNEEAVAELAFKWLSGQGLEDADTNLHCDETPHMTLTAFECSNFKILEQAAEKCIVDDFSAITELEIMFTAVSNTVQPTICNITNLCH
jgi:hypothetical protein